MEVQWCSLLSLIKLISLFVDLCLDNLVLYGSLKIELEIIFIRANRIIHLSLYIILYNFYYTLPALNLVLQNLVPQ